MITKQVRTRFMEDIEEIKKIALRLLARHGQINAGMIWAAGKVSYTNAQKAIDALEAEGKIFRQPKNGDENADTFWK